MRISDWSSDVCSSDLSTGGDRIIEADSSGNENAIPRQDTAIANATFVSGGAADNPDSILLRGGTDFTILNSVVTGAPVCLDLHGNAPIQAANAGPDEKGPPRFESVFLSCPDPPFRADAAVTSPPVSPTLRA